MKKTDKPYSAGQVIVLLIVIAGLTFLSFFRSASSPRKTGNVQTVTATDTQNDGEQTAEVENSVYVPELYDAVRVTAFSDLQEINPDNIPIGCQELEGLFLHGEAVMKDNIMNYNPEDLEPIYFFREKIANKKAHYDRFSPTLKIADKTWVPQIGSPGLMMTSPFRFFTFYSDAVRYQDYQVISSVVFNRETDVVRTDGQVPDIRYYGDLLGRKDSFTFRELAPVLWLVRQNYLIGYKDHISWFKVPGEEGTMNIVRCEPGKEPATIMYTSAITADTPTFVVLNRMVLYRSAELNYRVFLGDMDTGNPDEPYMGNYLDGEGQSEIRAWSYLCRDNNIYFAYVDKDYVHYLYFTDCDLTNIKAWKRTALSQFKRIHRVNSAMIYIDQDGVRKVCVSDAENIFRVSWED